MLQRSLLLTTALVLPVSAEAAFEIKTGGYMAVQAGIFENDAPNKSGRDLQSEAEIFLTATSKTDGGLTYGGRLEFQASTSDVANADEMSIFLSDKWGRVELGDNDGVAELIPTAPSVGIGQVNGSYDDFMPAADRTQALNNRGLNGVRPLATADATKISYTTPRYYGWQVGASYTPEARNTDGDGENIAFSKTGSGDDVADVMELGLNYDENFSDIRLRAGGGFVNGSAKSTAVEDLMSWSLGVQTSYKNFTLGGLYVRDGDSLNTANTPRDKVSSYMLGAAYELGNWGLGLSYLRRDMQDNGYQSAGLPSDGTGGTYRVVAIGGVYKIAPGLTAGADLAFYDRNRASGNDTNGTVFVSDITATF